MTDKTQLSSATGGDIIRTVAKAATGAKISAALIDVGGGLDSSPEVFLTLGQATKAASLPVTLASDQGAATDASLTTINATLLSQAVATSTKGNPSTQVLTVQSGNEMLLIGPFTRTDASSPFFLQEIDTDGLSFCSVALYLSALGTNAIVVLQGTGDPAGATGWISLRMQQPNGETSTSSLSSSVTIPGVFEADCGGYRWIRAIHSAAPTGGTSTTIALKFNRARFVRQTVAATGTQTFGFLMNGNMMRTAVKAAQGLAEAVSADAVATDLISTVSGALITNPYAPPEATWAYTAPTGGIATSGATQVAAAPGAGVRNFIRTLHLKNVGATASEVSILDGATAIWRGYLPAGMTANEQMTFDPPLRQPTINAALNLNINAAGAQVYASAMGWAGP